METEFIPTEAWKRARKILNLKEVSPQEYIVSGGSQDHTVVIHSDNSMHCDCKPAEIGLMCSHVWRVKMRVDPEIRTITEESLSGLREARLKAARKLDKWRKPEVAKQFRQQAFKLELRIKRL